MRQEQSENAADQSEWDVDENEQGAADGFKGVKEQNEDQEDADGNDDHEAAHGAFLILKFAAPGDIIAGRHVDVCFDALLHVRNDASHVAAMDEDGDGHDTRAIFPADIHAAAGNGETRQIGQGDVQAGGSIDEDVFEVENAPFGFRQAHDNAKMFLAFPEFRRSLASEASFDHVLNIRNVEAVAGRALAIDGDVGLGNFAHAI